MKRCRLVPFVMVVAVLLATGASAEGVPGTVLRHYSLSMKTPTGLAWDGQHLWVADLDGATLSEIDPETGATLTTLTRGLPAIRTGMGRLAALGRGRTGQDRPMRWIRRPGSRSERCRSIPTRPRGSCGMALPFGRWTRAPGSSVALTMRTEPRSRAFPNPMAHERGDELGLAFDGVYLWVSDRFADTIYRVDPATGRSSICSPRRDRTRPDWRGTGSTCGAWITKLESWTSWRRRAARRMSSTSRGYQTLSYTEAWRELRAGDGDDPRRLHRRSPRSAQSEDVKAPVFDPTPQDYVTDKWGISAPTSCSRTFQPGKRCRRP